MMKSIFTAILVFLFAMMGAAQALAQGGAGHGGHGAGGMNAPQSPQAHGGGGHAGMPMDAAMIMLGSAIDEGVQAMAHLRKLNQEEKHNGAARTHNFMVAFQEDKNGSAITEGRAAVKVAGPDGQAGSAVTLNLIENYFSTDLELKTPGRYTFTVGTKLLDGKTRQFSFSHDLK